MDANLRKRKRNVVRSSSTSYAHAGGLNALDASTTRKPDPGTIRVREAYLLADYPERGKAVETRDISTPDGTSGTSVKGGLISWKLAVGHNRSKSLIDDSSITDVWGVEGSEEIAGPDKDTDSEDDDDVWVDRFDAHLLLTSLPTISVTNHPPSDDDEETWSDLPSDSEDTFFLTPLETQAYHRDKRFRAMDRLRTERMQALEAQEAEAERHSNTVDKDPWGDDDEEPTSQAQLDLMTRTAKHILSSPNPTQLESRILANHGMDPRFAFLRGRWKRRWDAIKAKSAAPLPPPPLAARPTLVAYGSESDSDTNSGSVNNGGGAHPQDEAPRSTESNIAASAPALNVEHGHADTNANPSLGPSEKPNSDVTANQAAKRARLREWSQKRREAKTEGAG